MPNVAPPNSRDCVTRSRYARLYRDHLRPKDRLQRIQRSRSRDRKRKKAEKLDKPAEEPEERPIEQTNTGEASTQQVSQLTPDELKQINDVAQIIKTGLPKSQADAVEEAVELMKRGGIPQELRDVLEERREDPSKRMDLGTTVRLVRLFTKITRMTPEEIRENHGQKDIKYKDSESKESEQSEEPPLFEQSNQNKNGSKDRKRKQSQQQQGTGPKIYELKLDASTMILTAFVTYYLYRSLYPGESSRDITWQEFRTTFFDKGLVHKLTVINRNRVRVELHRQAVAQRYPESPAAQPNFYYYFSIGSVEAFERHLDEAQQELGIPNNERIPVAYSDEVPLSAALFSFGPTILFVGALFWLSRRAASGAGGQSGIFGIGKSRGKEIQPRKRCQDKVCRCSWHG